MIKEYIIPGSEKTFKTITLPPATVLFRGINYHSSTNKYSLFSDLLGYNTDDGFKISPTQNVFFYPAPYISDSVSEYNLHSIYLTNYEIELILLIKPEILHRASTDGPIIRCSDVGDVDKCGHDMKSFDPCLKDEILQYYPQITGYIAIAEKDSEHFIKLYKRLLYKKKFSKIRHILSSVSINSRGLISIPEIVLYPLHKRDNECHIIRNEIYDIQSTVKYCIKNRALFNYFPLLYINENGVYSFNDINEKLLNTIRQYERVKMGPDNKIFHIINGLINKFLSPKGYKVNGISYKFTIDIRTGYYIANTVTNSIKVNKTVKNTKNNIRLINENGKIPFEYSLSDKLNIMNIISMSQLYDLDELEKTVNKHDYSIKNKYIFNKGSNKTIHKLGINKVLERRDLIKDIKQQYNRTRKNII